MNVKYKQLLHSLGAVALAAVGVQVMQAGGDWMAAFDALATAVLTGLIKLLNPFDQDGGVVRPSG